MKIIAFSTFSWNHWRVHHLPTPIPTLFSTTRWPHYVPQLETVWNRNILERVSHSWLSPGTPGTPPIPNALHQLDEAKLPQLRSEGPRLTSKLEPQTIQGGVIAALAGTFLHRLSGFRCTHTNTLAGICPITHFPARPPPTKFPRRGVEGNLEEATAQSISGNTLNILMANKSIFRNEFTMIQDQYLLNFFALNVYFPQIEGINWKFIRWTIRRTLIHRRISLGFLKLWFLWFTSIDNNLRIEFNEIFYLNNNELFH